MTIKDFELWYYNKKTKCSTLVSVVDRISAALIWCKANNSNSDDIYYIVEVNKCEKEH